MGTLVIRKTCDFGTGTPASWITLRLDSTPVTLPQMEQFGLDPDGETLRPSTTEILAYYPTLGPDTVWDIWQDMEEQYRD